MLHVKIFCCKVLPTADSGKAQDRILTTLSMEIIKCHRLGAH